MLQDYDFRIYAPSDFDHLVNFLHKLSPKTRENFAPHPFDTVSIRKMLYNDPDCLAFIAIDLLDNILAYQVLKRGLTEHDRLRISTYGVDLPLDKTCSFAPVVIENRRSTGISTALLNHVKEQLVSWHLEYLLLWGGVKDSNRAAIAFYLKNGFQPLGKI